MVGQPYRLSQNGGQVVAHDIDSLELLHKLSAGAQKKSAEGLGVVSSFVAAGKISPFRGVLDLILDAILDIVQLGKHERIIFRLVFESCKNYEGFFFAIFGDEPAGQG